MRNPEQSIPGIDRIAITVKKGTGAEIENVGHKGEYNVGDKLVYKTKKGDLRTVEVLAASGDKEGKKGLQLRHIPEAGQKRLPDFAITGVDKKQLAEQLVEMTPDEPTVEASATDSGNVDTQGGRRATEDIDLFSDIHTDTKKDMADLRAQVAAGDEAKITDIRTKIDGMSKGGNVDKGGMDQFFTGPENIMRARAGETDEQKVAREGQDRAAA